MTHLCMLRGDVDIRAICDIDHEMTNTTLNIIKKSGNKPPDIYKKNEHDFLNLKTEMIILGTLLHLGVAS